jgi:hypothetical protein
MLINEFLKEHRKNEEQETTIAQLKQNFQFKLAEHQKQLRRLLRAYRESAHGLN